jgi:hypothetical protein
VQYQVTPNDIGNLEVQSDSFSDDEAEEYTEQGNESGSSSSSKQ